MVFHFPKIQKTISPKCPLFGHMDFVKIGMAIAKNHNAFKISRKTIFSFGFSLSKNSENYSVKMSLFGHMLFGHMLFGHMLFGHMLFDHKLFCHMLFGKFGISRLQLKTMWLSKYLGKQILALGFHFPKIQKTIRSNCPHFGHMVSANLEWLSKYLSKQI